MFALLNGPVPVIRIYVVQLWVVVQLSQEQEVFSTYVIRITSLIKPKVQHFTEFMSDSCSITKKLLAPFPLIWMTEYGIDRFRELEINSVNAFHNDSKNTAPALNICKFS